MRAEQHGIESFQTSSRATLIFPFSESNFCATERIKRAHQKSASKERIKSGNGACLSPLPTVTSFGVILSVILS
jgi:hypothetical protein